MMNDTVSDVLFFENSDFLTEVYPAGNFDIPLLNPQTMLQNLMDLYSVHELSDYRLH